MTDPDDEAFSWEGDERLRASAAPPPRLVDDRSGNGSGGPAALLVLGVLGGVALLEAAFWARGVLDPAISSSIDATSSGGAVPFVINAAGRVLAVAAPLAWFGAVLAVVRVPSRRIAWLALGAVLLVPWPAVLATT